jgi:hypothetical protein
MRRRTDAGRVPLMPSCNIGDKPLADLLDQYGARISARVAETDGNRFDIALEVDGVEIACLRLRGASQPVLIYTNVADQPAGLARGFAVPLP